MRRVRKAPQFDGALLLLFKSLGHACKGITITSKTADNRIAGVNHLLQQALEGRCARIVTLVHTLFGEAEAMAGNRKHPQQCCWCSELHRRQQRRTTPNVENRISMIMVHDMVSHACMSILDARFLGNVSQHW